MFAMIKTFNLKLANASLGLKIASRSMRRNVAQTILIILIIALPVGLASAVITAHESQKASTLENLTMTLGKTQAEIIAQTAPTKNLFQVPNDNQLFTGAEPKNPTDFANGTIYARDLNHDLNSDGTFASGVIDPRTQFASGTPWLTQYGFKTSF